MLTDTPPDSNRARHQRIVMLRGSIKLLALIGFIFVLLPFFKSIPWPQTKLPEGSILLSKNEIAVGETRSIELANGSALYVTRVAEIQRNALLTLPETQTWSPTAPGLLQQNWWVVSAISAQDEAVQFLPAQGDWRGGFTASSGAAWDLAGRALKPGPGHPYAMTVQNLIPMPWKTQGDGILLLPLPAPPSSPDSATDKNTP